MNNLCFNDTPPEIKETVFDYLSLNEKAFIYNWDTEGLSLMKEEGSKKFTIKHILKCCVLSKTVSLLSKRIDFLNNLETKKEFIENL